MTKKISKALSLFLLAFILFSAILGSTYELIIPDAISCGADGAIPTYPLVSSYDTQIHSDLSPIDNTALVTQSVDYRL